MAALQTGLDGPGGRIPALHLLLQGGVAAQQIRDASPDTQPTNLKAGAPAVPGPGRLRGCSGSGRGAAWQDGAGGDSVVSLTSCPCGEMS